MSVCVCWVVVCLLAAVLSVYARTGSSLLLVGVLGPAGPCSEVSVRRLTDINDANAAGGQYVVSYCPSVAGPHTIVVKWADQHIAGSPFNVDVVTG